VYPLGVGGVSPSAGAPEEAEPPPLQPASIMTTSAAKLKATFFIFHPLNLNIAFCKNYIHIGRIKNYFSQTDNLLYFCSKHYSIRRCLAISVPTLIIKSYSE
jgi:hypothetical protein